MIAGYESRAIACDCFCGLCLGVTLEFESSESTDIHLMCHVHMLRRVVGYDAKVLQWQYSTTEVVLDLLGDTLPGHVRNVLN